MRDRLHLSFTELGQGRVDRLTGTETSAEFLLSVTNQDQFAQPFQRREWVVEVDGPGTRLIEHGAKSTINCRQSKDTFPNAQFSVFQSPFY